MTRKGSWERGINDKNYGVYYSTLGPVKIVTIKRYKSKHAGRLNQKFGLWYHDEQKLVAQALSEAVATRERREEKKDELDSRMEDTMSIVEETYTNE